MSEETKPVEVAAAPTPDQHAHPHHNLFQDAKDLAKHILKSFTHLLPHLGEIAGAAAEVGVNLSPQARAIALGISVIAAAEKAKNEKVEEPTPAPVEAAPTD